MVTSANKISLCKWPRACHAGGKWQWLNIFFILLCNLTIVDLPPMENNLQTALDFFETHLIKISSCILSLLSETSLQNHPQVKDLWNYLNHIISAFSPPQTLELGWSFSTVKKRFRAEVQKLITEGEDWQFGASQTTTNRFRILRSRKWQWKWRLLHQIYGNCSTRFYQLQRRNPNLICQWRKLQLMKMMNIGVTMTFSRD